MNEKDLSNKKAFTRTKRSLLNVIMIGLFVVSGCANDHYDADTDMAEDIPPVAEYHKISQQRAKEIMDSGEPYILVDVRTKEEYDEGHIQGAVLIPVDEIADRAQTELPDKEALILVYCRAGVRSKAAAEILVELGYSNVQDIGGIVDWPYDNVASY